MESILTEIKQKKTKTVRSSASVLEAIQATSLSSRTIFAAIRGVRHDLAELEQLALANGTCFRGGTESEVILQNKPLIGGYLSILPFLEKAAACRRYLEILESSPEGTAAEASLQPLIEELKAAEESERVEADKAARAQQDVRDAKVAALAELESKLDDHPLVVEAKKKAAPFFRKGELVTA